MGYSLYKAPNAQEVNALGDDKKDISNLALIEKPLVLTPSNKDQRKERSAYEFRQGSIQGYLASFMGVRATHWANMINDPSKAEAHLKRVEAWANMSRTEFLDEAVCAGETRTPSSRASSPESDKSMGIAIPTESDKSM